MKAAQQIDKTQWIEMHGSSYLRRATRHGYACTRRYLRERAEQELPPGFFVMEDPGPGGRLPAEEPSEAALDLVERLLGLGHSPAVVRTPTGEAVVIREFLGDHRYVAMAYVQ